MTVTGIDTMYFFAIGGITSAICIAMFFAMAFQYFDDKDNFWGLSAVWCIFNTPLWFALTPFAVTLFLIWIAYKYYEYKNMDKHE